MYIYILYRCTGICLYREKHRPDCLLLLFVVLGVAIPVDNCSGHASQSIVSNVQAQDRLHDYHVYVYIYIFTHTSLYTIYVYSMLIHFYFYIISFV